MTQIERLKSDWVSLVFALFCGLATLDAVLIVGSAEYREFFGATRGISGAIWRLLPDAVMIFFYGLVYLKMKNGWRLPRLMFWHGVFYGLLGLILCLPWGGYFIAPFTPIGVLYLVPILWLPLGYFVSIGVAITFICFNGYLIWAERA